MGWKLFEVLIGPDVLNHQPIIRVLLTSFLKFLEGRIVSEEMFCTDKNYKSIFFFLNIADNSILLRIPIIFR